MVKLRLMWKGTGEGVHDTPTPLFEPIDRCNICAMRKIDPKKIVKKYYAAVDSKSYDSVCELFDKKIIYLRCEKKISGIDNLKKFYAEERQITGKHTILNIVEGKNIIAVRGVFKGKDRHRKNCTHNFADFFTFNSNGKIKERYTYLSHGSEKIQ